jgi:predicted kinase
MPTSPPARNKLLIICGLSFAGKSTLAKAIAARFGYEEVDVDVTKIQLFGQTIKDEELHPDDWARMYAETDRRIEHLLVSGKSVVDASRNFRKDEREIAKRIADNAGVPIITIYIDTPEEIARQRLMENRRMPVRRNVTDSDFDDVIRAMQPPSDDETPLIFHYADGLEDWLEKHSSLIAPSNEDNWQEQ